MKQAKDPGVLKDLNKYIKFRTQMAVVMVNVGFLNDFITRQKVPSILHRDRIKVTSRALMRQALKELDSWNSQIKSLIHLELALSEAV